MADNKPKSGQQMQIKLHQDATSGEAKFSNMATIEHSDDAFLLDFLFVHGRTKFAKVLSRIALSPQHAKRLALALEENITRYEARHGTITVGAPPVDPQDIN